MLNNQGNSSYMIITTKSFIILPLLFVFVFVGCNKEPEYIPGQGIQGIREPIFRILLSPVAYDGAIVVIEGLVQDYSEHKAVDSENSEDIETSFKLYDTRGNHINIAMPGSWEIADNDYLIVGGIYRQNINLIEAEQFEKVQFKELEEEKDKEIEKRDDW